MPKRIVCLGGGYLAISVARGLQRAIEAGEIELTVITKTNFHIWHGFIGEMLVGKIQPSQILSPARKIFAPGKVQVANVERIDLEGKCVHTTRHPDGKPVSYAYDQLIIAVGSRQNTSAYPGLAEHAFKLKTWDDCFGLRNHLRKMFEQASITADPAERRAMLTFFVAGGGFSGTEVAGELATLARELCRTEYQHLDVSELRTVLVHSGETLLPELYGAGVDERQFKQYPKLVAYAMQHIAELGVELRTNTRVKAVTPNLIVLDNGERIPSRTIISAVGTRAQAIVEDLPVPKDGRGRIVVDEYCRVKGLEDVYAGGDCAAVPHPRGGSCPPTALWALKAGDVCAANALHATRGQPPEKFAFTGLGQAVSIGRHTAVAELWGIPMKGTLAWFVWRAFLYYYFPWSPRKVQLLIDWLLFPFLGYDIVDMHIEDRDDFEIRYTQFQPHERIAVQGDSGHIRYLILDGELDLKVTAADGTETTERVGEGARIGPAEEDGICRHTATTASEVKAVAYRLGQAEALRALARLVAEHPEKLASPS